MEMELKKKTDHLVFKLPTFDTALERGKTVLAHLSLTHLNNHVEQLPVFN